MRTYFLSITEVCFCWIYRLAVFFFFFPPAPDTEKMLCHFLLTFMVSNEKSVIPQICIPLLGMCHFSLTTFKFVSLSLIFGNLTIMCFDVILFCFVFFYFELTELLVSLALCLLLNWEFSAIFLWVLFQSCLFSLFLELL